MHGLQVNESATRISASHSNHLSVVAPGSVAPPSEGALYHLCGLEIDWSISGREFVLQLFPGKVNSQLPAIMESYDHLITKRGKTLDDLYLLWWGEAVLGQCMNLTDEWCAREQYPEHARFEYAHPRYAAAIVKQFPHLVAELRSLPILDNHKERRYPYHTAGFRSGVLTDTDRATEPVVPVGYLTGTSPSLTIEIASVPYEDQYMLFTLVRR